MSALAEQLRDLMAVATRGTWSVTSGVVPSLDGAERVIVQSDERANIHGGYSVANCGPIGEYGSKHDADLIVAAVNALPKLLRAVEVANALLALHDDPDQAKREAGKGALWAELRGTLGALK